MEPCRYVDNAAASDGYLFAWSPDGAHIAYRGNRDTLGVFRPGIYIVDTLGGPQRLVHEFANFFEDVNWISWSPDGSLLALTDVYDILLLDLATGVETGITPRNRGISKAAWTRDGQYILYGRSKSNNEPDTLGGLHLLRVSDHADRAFLHDGIGTTGDAAISPDGLRLVLTFGRPQFPSSNEPTVFDLYVVNFDGTGYARVATLQGTAQHTQWTNDGSRIFFDFTPGECQPVRSANRATYSMRPDGSDLRKWPVALGDTRASDGFPIALSPVSARAVFSGLDSAGTWGVVTVRNLDGSGTRQLTRVRPWAPNAVRRVRDGLARRDRRR